MEIVSAPSMKREFVIYVENHIVENRFDPLRLFSGRRIKFDGASI
jgi:hypothetical protein